jgi:hypothetical protein
MLSDEFYLQSVIPTKTDFLLAIQIASYFNVSSFQLIYLMLQM